MQMDAKGDGYRKCFHALPRGIPNAVGNLYFMGMYEVAYCEIYQVISPYP